MAWALDALGHKGNIRQWAITSPVRSIAFCSLHTPHSGTLVCVGWVSERCDSVLLVNEKWNHTYQICIFRREARTRGHIRIAQTDRPCRSVLYVLIVHFWKYHKKVLWCKVNRSCYATLYPTSHVVARQNVSCTQSPLEKANPTLQWHFPSFIEHMALSLQCTPSHKSR